MRLREQANITPNEAANRLDLRVDVVDLEAMLDLYDVRSPYRDALIKLGAPRMACSCSECAGYCDQADPAPWTRCFKPQSARSVASVAYGPTSCLCKSLITTSTPSELRTSSSRTNKTVYRE